MYPVVFFDALRVKIREDAVVRSKAVYLALGVLHDGTRDTQATALKGKRFETIDEQNEYLEHWETKWAASRIHGSERHQVQAIFEEERAQLQPLPVLTQRFLHRSGC